MNLGVHYRKIIILVITALIILAGVRVAPFEFETSQFYNPTNWAGVSIAIGAAILTLVGIITSIVVSNENDRRVEVVDNLDFVLEKVKQKARINANLSFKEMYDNSEQKIEEAIIERSRLNYSDGTIGLISFFCFVISSVLAIESFEFKWVYFTFLLGLALIVGYVTYCLFQFRIIDKLSQLPEKNGNLSLRSVRINGEDIHFDRNNKAHNLTYTNLIRRMGFGLKFTGQVRNGFFHATVIYKKDDDQSKLGITYVPEPNTYLGNTVFADGVVLVISPDKRLDTGIMQSDKPVEIFFEICKGFTDNEQIGETEIQAIGKKPIRKYCSIPEGFHIELIEFRVYEDPLFRSSYKRREVDTLTVNIERTTQG